VSEPDAPTLIRADSLTKRYGTVVAVADVCLSIKRGEFFSLLGPSGCGKTTLLRLIGGFALPDRGRVEIDGEDVTALPPNRRPTNTVFQSYAIFPHLNVRDNIAYGLRTARVTQAELQARVAQALAMIKLEHCAEKYSHQLSGGERQRVALARALVKRPKVLLLDEPLGALDKRLREAMQIELRQLQREVGISFVFVTHDQEEALSMSDRIAVMDKGKVLQVADPKTLYEAPCSRAVAAFIGTMNMFEGRILKLAQRTMTVEANALGRFEIPRREGTAFTAGSPVCVAIRPENLALFRGPGTGEAVPCRVLTTAFLGDRSLVQVGVDGADTSVTVAVPHSRSAGAEGLVPGTSSYLYWRSDAVVLLPPD
jgi:spermidine/putrescine transport system ATP-binding protein/putrescine transport system ATP-binding protein